ncbi:hypothetical protein NEFER03_0013 [Nematocida sp. LUAm3]|nr:hypothetical protein NEFER03_0013 [Nematocida sp. LUAm3]KAI5173495.1 hypothetical protein NEFER02_0011 [Nematocida sp. LUAm2]KAI5176688.1 hypothetical protein NEFER01_0013 [Nematocida sp. LUAm1]
MHAHTAITALLLGGMHPYAANRRNRTLLLSATGVALSFHAACRLEYLNMLRGRRISVMSPGNALFFAGFYATGALTNTISNAFFNTLSTYMLRP